VMIESHGVTTRFTGKSRRQILQEELRTYLHVTQGHLSIWSVYNDSAGAKRCRLRSTSIWEGGDSLLTKQSQEVLCFQWQRDGNL
jgi:hypothetical protein